VDELRGLEASGEVLADDHVVVEGAPAGGPFLPKLRVGDQIRRASLWWALSLSGGRRRVGLITALVNLNAVVGSSC
jgi:hypothetical protein